MWLLPSELNTQTQIARDQSSQAKVYPTKATAKIEKFKFKKVNQNKQGQKAWFELRQELLIRSHRCCESTTWELNTPIKRLTLTPQIYQVWMVEESVYTICSCRIAFETLLPSLQ